MNIFASLVQGDSATWQDDPVQLSDGRQADFAGGWVLTYAIRGPALLDLTATGGDGVTWSTTLATTDSLTLTPGTYAWSAAVTNAGTSERLTVGTGQLAITLDLALVTSPLDVRTTAQVALDNCEVAMATFNATGGKVRKYMIGGREMEFQSITDLMQLHSFWVLKVKAEQTANLIAQGLGNPRNLYVRHVAPQ